MSLVGIRGFLFDLDGTLVDSVPDLAVAIDRMLADFRRAPAGEEKVRTWVGNGSKNLVKRALSGALDGEVPTDLLEDALARFFVHYEATLCIHSRLYEGVAEGVAQLQADGYAMAVVTNKPARFAKPLLEALGIDGCFSAIIGGECLPQKKPHPAPLLHTAELIGCVPAETLMVGDSVNDIEAARRANMPVVCVPYGYNHGKDIRDFKPDVVINGVHELPALVNEAA
ncbi:phosphoglycolate phosphatase [Alkalilimnicola ehrlichii]|uniref:Phosphoglycolate phosphatase n=1 Tax=Alkalilimnicola ehrlichii TaxID=351052 RepID=A0A3E0X485_9GAMM|nr:phosphoglycolate phosphatase [Alkalilimnicola ehrlichii]RFA31227.1 phosphoglycolate phosphatase [Alkalilimnicola ehrlichii]RFA39495.1 phosphoglycolate phosphatase [Alkalilimnicola ehrlichii]